MSSTKSRPKKETVMVRRMPDSLVAEFGPRLADMDWSFLAAGLSADRMVEDFESTAARLVDKNFPQKEVALVQMIGNVCHTCFYHWILHAAMGFDLQFLRY